jgi:hypothetical protein
MRKGGERRKQPTFPGPTAVPGNSGEASLSAGTPATVGWSGALRTWGASHREELLLFVACFALFAAFSSQRFLRQSAAPHFVYQAKAWLEGRLDLDPQVLPNLEDWACVREIGDRKVRCQGPVLSTDRWYVSFPAFPAVAMLPFVALHGYQFNDTSFTVVVGALAIALFYALLSALSRSGESDRDGRENLWLSLVLAFGTLFFYCTIRGEVWFTAEVIGVALTCLYILASIDARRPALAGLFYSMAALTRTPLIFAGAFFLLECLCPGPAGRWRQLSDLRNNIKTPVRKLALFAAGAAPLAIAAAIYNQLRFGQLTEFGHRFLYNNRVNADIDQFGLFSIHYLSRNLDAAFLKLPQVGLHPLRLSYDPHGLSLLLTLPVLMFVLVPKKEPRLHWPLWLTVAACALPGFFYQNTGYIQFGFRFSLDYTPYLLLLFAIGGWSLRSRWVMLAALLGVLVNFWGAVAFRGYTEIVRNW